MPCPDDEEEDYYPVPGEKAFEEYFRKRRFFRIRDVLGLLLGKRRTHTKNRDSR